MLITILLLFIGLGVLIVGGEMLIRGATSIAPAFGISTLVIGLTIVAFGTSAPELVVNLVAALSGNTDIAFGNVVGSNIVNILIILGVSALITSLRVKNSTVWKEIPFAFLAALMLLVFSLDTFFDKTTPTFISQGEGLALLGFFAVFFYYIIELAKKGEQEEVPPEQYSKPISILFIFLGLLTLFFGGKIFVDQAVVIAKLFGMSELFIGLTIVAIGTSLPELVTSIIAARKGESNLAIGNIVGSNIFNIFFILGVTSVIRPVPVSQTSLVDLYVCIFATAMLFIFLFFGKKHQITKGKGILFILVYVAYCVYLVMRG